MMAFNREARTNIRIALYRSGPEHQVRDERGRATAKLAQLIGRSSTGLITLLTAMAKEGQVELDPHLAERTPKKTYLIRLPDAEVASVEALLRERGETIASPSPPPDDSVRSVSQPATRSPSWQYPHNESSVRLLGQAIFETGDPVKIVRGQQARVEVVLSALDGQDLAEQIAGRLQFTLLQVQQGLARMAELQLIYRERSDDGRHKCIRLLKLPLAAVSPGLAVDTPVAAQPAPAGGSPAVVPVNEPPTPSSDAPPVLPTGGATNPSQDVDLPTEPVANDDPPEGEVDPEASAPDAAAPEVRPPLNFSHTDHVLVQLVELVYARDGVCEAKGPNEDLALTLTTELGLTNVKLVRNALKLGHAQNIVRRERHEGRDQRLTLLVAPTTESAEAVVDDSGVTPSGDQRPPAAAKQETPFERAKVVLEDIKKLVDDDGRLPARDGDVVGSLLIPGVRARETVLQALLICERQGWIELERPRAGRKAFPNKLRLLVGLADPPPAEPVVDHKLDGMTHLRKQSQQVAWTQIHAFLTEHGALHEEPMERLRNLTRFSESDLRTLIYTLVEVGCLRARWIHRVLLGVDLGPRFKQEDVFARPAEARPVTRQIRGATHPMASPVASAATPPTPKPSPSMEPVSEPKPAPVPEPTPEPPSEPQPEPDRKPDVGTASPVTEPEVVPEVVLPPAVEPPASPPTTTKSTPLPAPLQRSAAAELRLAPTPPAPKEPSPAPETPPASSPPLSELEQLRLEVLYTRHLVGLLDEVGRLRPLVPEVAELRAQVSALKAELAELRESPVEATG